MKYLLIEPDVRAGASCDIMAPDVKTATVEAIEMWFAFNIVPYVLAFDLDAEGGRIEVARDGTDDLIEVIKDFAAGDYDRLNEIDGHPWLGDWPRKQMEEIEGETKAWERHIKAERSRAV